MWFNKKICYLKKNLADPKLSNDGVDLRSYWIVLINQN